MAKRKVKKKNVNEVNEPVAEYATGKVKRVIHFFSSPEEQEEFQHRQMAELNPIQLLERLERMRKIFLSKYLNTKGEWPKLKRIIKIQKPNRK